MTHRVSPELLALQEVLAGRYSIERELGRGGMGIVLLARDVALDRLVAVKLLPPDLAASRENRERFLREARVAAGLSHPNIVPIHAVEEYGDLVFFVMGFVDGETLGERVERAGPLTPRFAMKLMQEVAWALGYAHERGVVHRDIKPDNIMIDQATDRALVTDFGIAQVGRVDAEMATGEIIGTARYMSPEQACGDWVDGRSDLYSLAATMYFALTGRPPFEGATLPAILTQHVSHPPPAIIEARPEVPRPLARVIHQCLQKNPEDRLQTGDELARAVGDARGRDLRAPPLVRSFVRNAEVSTMVLLAVTIGGQTVTAVGGSVSVSAGGPGFIGSILIVQLVLLARRLLREGYVFDDIRAALLAEAQVQQEADVILRGRWMRRLDSMWHRLWAGRFGRWFFRMAGMGVTPPEQPAQPSADATEMVLGRATIGAFNDLSSADRSQLREVPSVVRRLEHHAAHLREHGDTGERLTQTVAALEKLRLALLRLQAGEGSVQDLTMHLERAKQIGQDIDRELQARQEVRSALEST